MATATRTRRLLTLLAMTLGFAVVQLDVSVVNVAVRSIGADLGGAVSDLQWVVNAYTVGFAAFILTAGALGDRIGARRVFVAGFALFMVASVACGLAPSLGALIAARAIQGVGAAILVPCSLSLLHHTYPEPAERTRAVGLWLAGSSLALAAGPLVGGLLIAGFGWRAIFFINVPLALAGIGLTIVYSTETTRSAQRRVDWVGQPLAVVALAALVGATIEGGVRGFGAPLVLAGFAVALLALAAFIACQARRAEPMLPLSLFGDRAFSVSAFVGILINVAVYGLVFLLSLFFQEEQRHTPLQTGLLLLPLVVAIGASNVVAARVARRLGAARSIALGAALLLAGTAGLLWIGAGTPYPALVAQLVVLGLGTGIVVPVITAQLLGSVESSRAGVAAGTLNTLRQTGSAIGVALFGSTLSHGGGFVAGVHVSLAIAVGIALVIIAVSPALRARPDRG